MRDLFLSLKFLKYLIIDYFCFILMLGIFLTTVWEKSDDSGHSCLAHDFKKIYFQAFTIMNGVFSRGL